MIVIATHEGKQFIENMLDSLRLCSHNEKILLVDTHSSEEYYEYLQTDLKNKYPEIDCCRTPYKGYDSGGYIYAYKNFVDEHYIFLHDSMIIKDIDLITNLVGCISENSVGVIVGFGPGGTNRNYDSKEDENWVGSHCASVDFDDGIFGPMFAVSRGTLQKLDESNHLIIPSKKNEQRAMERLWSVCFKIHGIGIKSLSRYNARSFHSEDYGLVQKMHPSLSDVTRQ